MSYCIWEGSCINTGSYKTRLYSVSENQIWEGGSPSQSPHFWNLELCCWTLGTCSRVSVTDTNLRRQINAKKEGKLFARCLMFVFALVYLKRAETCWNKCINFICYFNKKYANFSKDSTVKYCKVCQLLSTSKKKKKSTNPTVFFKAPAQYFFNTGTQLCWFWLDLIFFIVAGVKLCFAFAFVITTVLVIQCLHRVETFSSPHAVKHCFETLECVLLSSWKNNQFADLLCLLKTCCVFF